MQPISPTSTTYLPPSPVAKKAHLSVALFLLDCQLFWFTCTQDVLKNCSSQSTLQERLHYQATQSKKLYNLKNKISSHTPSLGSYDLACLEMCGKKLYTYMDPQDRTELPPIKTTHFSRIPRQEQARIRYLIECPDA